MQNLISLKKQKYGPGNIYAKADGARPPRGIYDVFKVVPFTPRLSAIPLNVTCCFSFVQFVDHFVYVIISIYK